MTDGRRASQQLGIQGECWCSTNGILHGCALSAVLTHLLTMMWKLKIDSMHQHVVVTPRQLPPKCSSPLLHGMHPSIHKHTHTHTCSVGTQNDSQGRVELDFLLPFLVDIRIWAERPDALHG